MVSIDLNLAVKGDLPQSTLQHLRWLLQKDQLGQDVFLIGPPGPARRLLAMAFLQLTKREAEFVSLTRDTTEADLKQRREIKAGTSFYCDQVSNELAQIMLIYLPAMMNKVRIIFWLAPSN